MTDDLFAAVGDNCIDRFLPPVDDCLVGGNAVNVAVQLAMLEAKVEYFGAVGGDAAGEAVRRALAERGVATANCHVVADQRTAYTDIEISEDGDRTFVFEEFGACAGYRCGPADIAQLRRMTAVHIGWLADGGALKRALAGSGVIVSQDLSVNNAPEHVSPSGLDIAFCSAEAGDAEASASRLLAAGARLAVVTMGAAGSYASDGTRRAAIAASPVTPEDTTGAGDAFIAGFLFAHARSRSLNACLSLGGERAALACLHRGGFPQVPLKGLAEPWFSP
jgi:fructoselysine 6-kinase